METNLPDNYLVKPPEPIKEYSLDLDVKGVIKLEDVKKNI